MRYSAKPGNPSKSSIRQIKLYSVAVAIPSVEQLRLPFDPPLFEAADPTATPVIVDALTRSGALERPAAFRPIGGEDVLAELLHQRSLTQGQTERIRHLEQALDQSLSCLNDLRLQLADQQFLEAHLASTEAISNIQQQAIVQLKHQLTQQQETLEQQRAISREQDQIYQERLAMLEALTQTQQRELERLRQRADNSDRDGQLTLAGVLSPEESSPTLLELESRSLAAEVRAAGLAVELEQTQVKVQELSQQLGDRQHRLHQLETELHRAHTELQTQQVVIDRLHRQQTISGVPGLADLTPDLKLAQTKIEELEMQLAKYLTTQAMLQHASQELELERDRQQNRITSLEKQAAEMQEQILKQAKQASEYETAIQHWKARYSSSQEQLSRLKQFVQQAVSNPTPELTDCLAALQLEDPFPEPASPASLTATTPISQVELPDFLVRRRRRYKDRRSS